MDLQISKSLTLPSGLVLPNRLVKAAMAEGMASKDGLPTPALRTSYAQWADSGWGMILTGNVAVDQRHLGQPGDVYLTDDEAQMSVPWKEWVKASKGDHKTPVVVQINHPGRQSPAGAGSRGFFGKALAPSAVPLQMGTGILGFLVSKLGFGTPKAMTVADIEDVVTRFANTARVSAEAGFDGVILRRYARPAGYSKDNKEEDSSRNELAPCRRRPRRPTSSWPKLCHQRLEAEEAREAGSDYMLAPVPPAVGVGVASRRYKGGSRIYGEIRSKLRFKRFRASWHRAVSWHSVSRVENQNTIQAWDT